VDRTCRDWLKRTPSCWMRHLIASAFKCSPQILGKRLSACVGKKYAWWMGDLSWCRSPSEAVLAVMQWWLVNVM